MNTDNEKNIGKEGVDEKENIKDTPENTNSKTEKGTPAKDAPEENTPVKESAESAPEEVTGKTKKEASAENTPEETTPVKENAESAPEEVTEKTEKETSAENTPEETTPVKESAESAPVDVTEKTEKETSAENTPEETTPVKESAESAPVDVTEKTEKEASAENTPEENIIKEHKTIHSEEKASETAKLTPDPDEDFDWDAFEGTTQSFATTSEKDEMTKLYDNTLSSVQEKEVLTGKIISLNKREVVINIGYKSDGVVSVNEFRYNPDLKVGDEVEMYVESLEDKKGQLLLSHKKARAVRSWDRVNAALDNDEIITGYIKCRTKGGMIVDVFGIEAFLPGSQIDVKPIRDYDIYVDKTMELKVVKINQEYKNVVVSHKALIEAELEQQRKEIIAKLEKGQILEGIVKNITSYGVFIDLGGVDGLIHITDLSWGRISHPSEVVQLDEKINVVILDFDDSKKRIALGLKQLTSHPWDNLDAKLKVGDVVKGKAVVIADYGAFIEIAQGIEGLVHVSEMSWSQHLRSAQDFLKAGDDVEVKILTLDREERKMSLGIKQLKPDPWEKIEEKYPIGSKHTARVRNFTNFGVFVEIEEGVDGLIHISDLSWTKKVKHPSEFTSVGANIEVVVLDVGKENRRLSLGHKQLEENPWDVFETIFTVDSIHEGTITEIFDKGAVISLQYGVEGFATPRHLIKEDGSKVKVDEKLDFKIIEFSKSAKRIILSHSRVFEDEKRSKDSSKKKVASKNTRKGMKAVKDSLEKTTLGDISELAKLKIKMEEDKGKKDSK